MRRFAFIALLAACGDLPRTETPVASRTVVRRDVNPTDTDAAIHRHGGDHVVMVPPAGHGAKLLVYLPGTHGRPDRATMFMETAAMRGYLAVSLDYPDEDAAAECKDDAHCYAQLREEVIYGVETSSIVDVGPADSIIHRLTALLDYLGAHFPTEGWSAFEENGQPAWSRIAFAGHSQGGGHAAFIAKKHEVARVLMFSSICDAFGEQDRLVAAPWVQDHVTPIERYWGFDHVNDKAARHVKRAWTALGLDALGPRVKVEISRPPYEMSHELVTDVPEANGQDAHGSVVVDPKTPKLKDGSPLFRPVWETMLGD